LKKNNVETLHWSVCCNLLWYVRVCVKPSLFGIGWLQKRKDKKLNRHHHPWASLGTCNKNQSRIVHTWCTQHTRVFNQKLLNMSFSISHAKRFFRKLV